MRSFTLRRALVYMLSFALAWEPSLALAESSGITYRQVQAQMLPDTPLWQSVLSSDWHPPKWGPFKADDPILDEDPFFLRAQSWIPAHAPASDRARVWEDRDGLEIQPEDSDVVLRLIQPLRPAFETAGFLFFQARDRRFFAAKGDGDSYGEGLFFIDKQDLLISGEPGRDGQRRPIPVMFLPMPNEGWTGPLNGVTTQGPAAEDEGLVISNSGGEMVDFDLKDLDELSHLYHANLEMTVDAQLSFEQEKLRTSLREQIEKGEQGRPHLPFVLPARGSTAAFGMYVTLLNLDHRGHSLSEIASNTPIWDLIFPRAHAELLSPDVIQRLLIVGSIAGGILVSSLVARMTKLRRRSQEIRAHLDRMQDELRIRQGLPPIARNSLAHKAKSFSIDVFDIFAQGLTAADFAPKIAFGYGAEYAADRWFGRSGRLPNGLIRRFLKYTLLYDRQNAEEVLANAETLLRGSGIHGGIDTGLVIVQLLFISPVFFPWVAGFVNQDLQARVALQFSGADAATSNVITSEIMRNLAGYLRNGAFDYAGDMVNYYLQILTSEVENQMRREGKNPQDPRLHTELSTRVKARLNTLLVERGLPSADERLFSAPSMVRTMMKNLGYERLPDHKLNRDELTENLTFVLEHGRWGVINYALNQSIKESQELRRLRRDSTTKHVVDILVETKKDFNALRSMLRHPGSYQQIWEKAKEVRQRLTTMSYAEDGQFESAGIRFLNAWKGAYADPKAAELSARLFRQALFSVLDDRPYYLRPSPAQNAKYLPEALAEAEERLNREQGPDHDEFDRRIVAREIVQEKIAAEESRGQLESWQPTEPKWSELDFGTTRRQLIRIQAQAMRATARSLRIPLEDLMANPELILSHNAQETYFDAYRHAWSREVGLYAYPKKYSELVRLALKEANEKVEGTLRAPNMVHYLSRFNESERLKIVARLGAEAFVEKYVELTVSNSRTVSLISPEQPGVFQRFRQMKIATQPGRLGKAITMTLRVLETPWPNNSYALGGKSWRHRYIPFLRDFSTAVRNRAQTIFGAMTATYAANYFIWQARFPWSVYLFLTLNATLLAQAKYLLDRFMMNIDKPPMDSNRRIALYGVLWSFLSYGLFIPFYFWNSDFKQAFDRYVGVPVHQVGDHARHLCEILLSAF